MNGLDLASTDPLVERLRALQPARPMAWAALRSVAEQQAALFLKLADIKQPPVPWTAISGLSGVVVDRRSTWPTSGMAVRIRDHWRIVVKAEEPLQRQRFSLAHELKHVLDDPVVDRVFPNRHGARNDRAEALCDYFAASLLMPRVWLSDDWQAGIRGVSELALRYDVSVPAMSRRLTALGLKPKSTTGTTPPGIEEPSDDR